MRFARRRKTLAIEIATSESYSDSIVVHILKASMLNPKVSEPCDERASEKKGALSLTNPLLLLLPLFKIRLALLRFARRQAFVRSWVHITCYCSDGYNKVVEMYIRDTKETASASMLELKRVMFKMTCFTRVEGDEGGGESPPSSPFSDRSILSTRSTSAGHIVDTEVDFNLDTNSLKKLSKATVLCKEVSENCNQQTY